MQQPSPLDGVIVADFSRVLAGPLATMTLGDLGATVVKVERPGTGDDTRTWSPPRSADGEATYFLATNRNKRSVTLDLAAAAGRSAARALALRADVLVENFPPGTMERFGLGYEELAAQNPGLVYASVTGFGRGAGAGLPGYDFLIQAVGGLMSITGAPDGEPTKVGVALVDVLAGGNLASGVLAALYARSRTGRGQRVDVTLLGSLLAALVNQASAHLNAGVTPGRMGNRHPSITPYETLRTADRPIAVAVGNDAQFARLAALVLGGAPDPRFATNRSRVRHREELVAALEAALAGRTAAEWIAELGAAGIACGPVNTVPEGFALAGSLGLEPVVRIPHGDAATAGVACPIALSQTPVAYRLPPPHLGEHTDEVLAWLSGADGGAPGDR
jgi:crotonobetainyl-CoA:carnitine CoA-transferase CaiB-like acyl-CoA transferase